MKELAPLLPQLLYFYDAVRLGSLTRASYARNVTQSTVSQAIKKLENMLDESLLVHQPRKLILTREGKRIFSLCEELFKTLAPFEERLFTAKNWEGPLNIGFSHSLALLLVPKLHCTLGKDHPDVFLKTKILHPNALKQEVLLGHLDYALALESSDLEGFSCDLLFRGKYSLFQHRSKQVPSVVFASMERHESLEAKHQLEAKGFQWIHIPSWELIAEMAAQGLGMAFMPDFLKKRYSGLKTSPHYKPEIPYSIFGFSLPSKPLSFLTESLTKLFQP